MIGCSAIAFLSLIPLISGKYAVQPTIREKNCPPGFVLNGKNCESSHTVPPSLICKGNTQMVNGQCLSYAAPFETCPPQFVKLGKSCSRTELVPVQYQCHEGELVGQSCRTFHQQPPRCPPGFIQQNGQCVQFTPIVKKCPAGYQQSGKTCSRKDSFPAEPACPEGFDLSPDSSKCVTFQTRPPYCPSGYTQDSNGQCSKKVPLIPVPCPHGHTTTGDYCERTDQIPATPTCPPDFQLGNGFCVRSLVSSSCPAGTKPTAYGDSCEKFVAPQFVCPDGSSSRTCASSTEHEPTPTCPNGYEFDGINCHKIDTYSPKMTCQPGSALNGDQCMSSHTSSAEYGCPHDYILSTTKKGTVCTRAVAYDCSTTTYEKQCEAPMPHIRKLKDEIQHKVVAPICRNVPVQVPRTCTKEEVVPASKVCPDGGALMGKTCRTTSMMPAIPICHAGEMDGNGRCLKHSTVSPMLKCHVGSLIQGRCVERTTFPANPICPPGTEETSAMGKGPTKCVSRIPMLTHTSEEKRAVIHVCDSGRLSGKACVSSERFPRARECPPGSVESNTFGGKYNSPTCILTAELIVPPPVPITAPLKFICPDGKITSSRQCFSTQTVPIEEFCPANSELFDRRCAVFSQFVQDAPIPKSTPAIPVCPMGMQLVGNMCKATETAPPTVNCPPGFDQSYEGSLKCVRAIEPEGVCPPGSISSYDGCTVKKIVAPQVTIVRTCTKGQPGC